MTCTTTYTDANGHYSFGDLAAGQRQLPVTVDTTTAAGLTSWSTGRLINSQSTR